MGLQLKADILNRIQAGDRSFLPWNWSVDQVQCTRDVHDRPVAARAIVEDNGDVWFRCPDCGFFVENRFPTETMRAVNAAARVN